MLRPLNQIALVVAMTASLSLSAAQAAITVDGNLSDWGAITVADNNGSVFGGAHMPNSLAMEEDQDDTTNNLHLGPYSGGQNYDAEFLAVSFDGQIMSIAIVTGQRPDNGFSNYGPGDIRIQTSAGLFGIEVGGGFGGGSGSAVTEGDLGTTYRLDGSGYTIGARTSDGTTTGNVTNIGAGAHTAGEIVFDPTWYNSSPSNNPTQFQLAGGTSLGSADYFFSRNAGVAGYYTGSQHSIIELSFNLSNVLTSAGFAGADVTVQQITWRPSCGNDELMVTPDYITTADVVPEPATIIVWSGLSFVLGAAGWRRRRQQPLAA